MDAAAARRADDARRSCVRGGGRRSHWPGACRAAAARASLRGRAGRVAAGDPWPAADRRCGSADARNSRSRSRRGGRLVGVVDAWFDEAAVAVEFDGRVKYTEPVARSARPSGSCGTRSAARTSCGRSTSASSASPTPTSVPAVARHASARLARVCSTRPGPSDRRFTRRRRADPRRPADRPDVRPHRDDRRTSRCRREVGGSRDEVRGRRPGQSPGAGAADVAAGKVGSGTAGRGTSGSHELPAAAGCCGSGPPRPGSRT